MTEMTWKATLDKHVSEPDLILGKLGSKFAITVAKDAITIKPLGCCAGKPVVLPLEQVVEVRLVQADWTIPSFVIVGEKPADEEGEKVRFFHKFFIDGGEESIGAACDKVNAQIRLLSGQVLVSGYIDSSVPNLVSWFSAQDTKKIFEMESTMITSTVGESKTFALTEMEGAVTFTRLTYGTEMLFSKEGMEVPCSVFCERVHTIQFTLPVMEEDVNTAEGDVVKAFRLKANKDANTKGTWTVTMEPKVVLDAPYLAGLKGDRAARPRVTSFNMPVGRFSMAGKKKAPKPAKAAPPVEPPINDVDAEGAAPAPEAAAPKEGNSPRGGLLSTIKRKASLTKGKPVEAPPPEADAEAPAK